MMKNRQDIFLSYLSNVTTYAIKIASKKSGIKIKGADISTSITTCRGIGEFLIIPWEETLKFITSIVWKQYKNPNFKLEPSKQTDALFQISRKETDRKIRARKENTSDWVVTLLACKIFQEASKLDENIVKNAMSQEVAFQLITEDDEWSDDKKLLKLNEKQAIDKWILKDEEELSIAYSKDIKTIIGELAKGNGSTEISVNGHQVDIKETEIFGHWSAFAEIFGINPEQLLSSDSDKKELLKFDTLCVQMPQKDLEEAYRNACFECAKSEFDGKINEMWKGKATGYGDALQIPINDTLNYTDVFLSKIYDDYFLDMLDGDEPEEEQYEESTFDIRNSSSQSLQKSIEEKQRQEREENRARLNEFFSQKCYVDSDLAERYKVTGLYIPFILGKSPQTVEIGMALKVESRLTSAKTAYAYEMQSDELFVACYDNTTIIGPAEYGCLLTNRGIYIRNSNENTATFISYADIKDIKPEIKTSNAAESNLAKSAVGFFSKFSKTAGNMFNSAMESFEYEKGFIVINDTIKLEADRMLSPKGGLEKFCKFVEDVKNRKFSETNLEKADTELPVETKNTVENKSIEAPKEEKPYKVNLAKKEDSLIKCPACGTDNDPNNKFCDECGAALKIKTPKLCPNCGQEVGEGKKFCGECGTKLI